MRAAPTIMSHYRLNYLDRIRELGHRVTPQRQLVLDTICERGGHATAREVYEQVRLTAPSVNRATVYRALDFFCALNLVAKTELAGRTVYEMMGEEPHHHIVCTACGQVAFVPDTLFDELAAQLWEQHGFRVALQHMALAGKCRHCLSLPPP
ncbi:MAG: transcriptional repressor [Anaerolineales bacterium]|nr:transcriptional repressor [Anaerolineales bacterium]